MPPYARPATFLADVQVSNLTDVHRLDSRSARRDPPKAIIMKRFAFLLLAAALAMPVSAQNLLTNGDFETTTGWTAFGNAFYDPGAGALLPTSGAQAGKLFGNFSGGFDVSGFFQAFPATAGDMFTLSVNAGHESGDPLTGVGPGNDNWAVAKIAYFDAGGVEIGGDEVIIVDGTVATDVWNNYSVSGTAPAGTTSVQALLLFLQPNNDGGSCFVDDAVFTGGGTPPPPPPSGRPVLADTGFEMGAGWNTFGNAFFEPASNLSFPPLAGMQALKMFGNFSGGFDVTGAFQSFPASPGDNFTLSGNAYHESGDALMGAGAPNFNWAVFKIAYFDAGGTEIGGDEVTCLDGTFATDTWHFSTVTGTAPAGTVQVQALILFLQPMNDGGAAFFDEMAFSQNYVNDFSQDPVTLDLTTSFSSGEPGALYGRFISVDPANATAPGAGAFFGLHLDPVSINDQINLVVAGVPPYGGFLDANGSTSLTIPGAALTGVSGVSIYILGLSVDGANLLATDVVGVTLL